jgi:hypothetical protein
VSRWSAQACTPAQRSTRAQAPSPLNVSLLPRAALEFFSSALKTNIKIIRIPGISTKEKTSLPPFLHVAAHHVYIQTYAPAGHAARAGAARTSYIASVKLTKHESVCLRASSSRNVIITPRHIVERDSDVCIQQSFHYFSHPIRNQPSSLAFIQPASNHFINLCNSIYI